MTAPPHLDFRLVSLTIAASRKTAQRTLVLVNSTSATGLEPATTGSTVERVDSPPIVAIALKHKYLHPLSGHFRPVYGSYILQGLRAISTNSLTRSLTASKPAPPRMGRK